MGLVGAPWATKGEGATAEEAAAVCSHESFRFLCTRPLETIMMMAKGEAVGDEATLQLREVPGSLRR